MPHNTVCLFPTVVVFTETQTHYIFEVFGARRKYKGMKSKRNYSESLNKFLGDFNYDGPTEYMVTPQKNVSAVISAPISMQDVALAAQRTITALESRFPGVASLFGSTLVRLVPEDIECIKSIDASGLNYPLIVGNSLLTNSLGSLVRARYTTLLVAIPRSMEAQQFSKMLKEYIPSRRHPHAGIQIARPGPDEAIAQAGQFANLYLQGLRETTLTQFLEDHADIIKKALNAEEVFFQAEFTWHDGNPDPNEKSIQPDLIIHRADGTWYIIDFKLPLLDHKSVTTGGHRRRRFVHPIADGVAQLHNYREYFDYEPNRRSAAIKLGEQIRDPNLMLVVGTSENVDLTEVSQAMRALKPIDIVDYDALIRLSVGQM